MRAEESKEIDGDTYTVRMLDPDTAMDVLVDLFDMVGESLSVVVSADPDDPEAEERAIATALRALVGKVSKDTVRGIVARMVKVSDVNNRPLKDTYKVHFMGRIGTLAKFLVFALQTQFRDFGDAFGDILTLQMPRSSREAGGGQPKSRRI